MWFKIISMNRLGWASTSQSFGLYGFLKILKVSIIDNSYSS